MRRSLLFRGRYRDTDEGWTYFIQGVNGGPIKIGSTFGSPTERLKQFQCGSPVRLRILLALEGIRHEDAMHDRFAHWRLHGEWFDEAAPDLQRLVQKVGPIHG